MPRLATVETFAPPLGGTLAMVERALLHLLTRSEPHEPGSPAAVACREAMRACAVQTLAIGCHQALDYLVARVRAADPSRADVREAILNAAWCGLPGGETPAASHSRRSR